jgi:NADH dehydrogenase
VAGGRPTTSSQTSRASPHKDFVYKDKGIMAMIGREAAIAELGKHHHEVHGQLAHIAWLGVHAT